MRVGCHKNVTEYDGAFNCLDCNNKWGALGPDYPNNASKYCDVKLLSLTGKTNTRYCDKTHQSHIWINWQTNDRQCETSEDQLSAILYDVFKKLESGVTVELSVTQNE